MPPKIKPSTAWTLMFNEERVGNLEPTRARAINEHEMRCVLPWDYLRRMGFRAVKVRITPVLGKGEG